MFYTLPESRGPRGKGGAANIPDFLLLTLLLMDQWCSQTNSANITVDWHLMNTGVKCAWDGLFTEWLSCYLSSHGWSRQEKKTAVRTEEASTLSLWERNGVVVSRVVCEASAPWVFPHFHTQTTSSHQKCHLTPHSWLYLGLNIRSLKKEKNQTKRLPQLVYHWNACLFCRVTSLDF